MSRVRTLACAALALLAAGCAETSPYAQVDVTRYHLEIPKDRGTVMVQPVAGPAAVTPEYQMYADAVGRALATNGYTPAGDPGTSDFIAGVSFLRATRGTLHERSPVSIGIGGGTWGASSGLSAGVAFPVGSGHDRDVFVNELAVQLRRRSDNTVIWEGRAQMQAVQGQPDAQPVAAADRMAQALFKGFPGESGVTITVK
jgi:hypothetical protein